MDRIEIEEAESLARIANMRSETVATLCKAGMFTCIGGAFLAAAFVLAGAI